jgi:hypothetical protein
VYIFHQTKHINGLEKVMCPKGTVPIQRITKDDLIRGKALFNEISQLTDNSIVSHVSFFSYIIKFSICLINFVKQHIFFFD